jgi:hypothetical protein
VATHSNQKVIKGYMGFSEMKFLTTRSAVGHNGQNNGHNGQKIMKKICI